MELGIYTFAEVTPDPQTGRTVEPGAAPPRSDRGDRARRPGRPRRLRRRRAPPPGLRRLGARGRARRRRRAHRAHPPDERGQRAQLGRPRARVPGLRDARPALGRPRGDHGRPRLVHRVVPAVRLRPRRLRRALRREARAAAAAARVGARHAGRAATARRSTTVGVYPRPSRTRCRSGSRSAARPSRPSAPGALGLPMALAIIGGLPERFAPFAELYRRRGAAGRTRPARRRSASTRTASSPTPSQQAADEVLPAVRRDDEPDRPRARLAAA